MDTIDLETRYRELYWYHNELQVIGGLEGTDEYRDTVAQMRYIEKKLGYVPEA